MRLGFAAILPTERCPDRTLPQLSFPHRRVKTDALGCSILVHYQGVLESVIQNLANGLAVS